MSRYEEEHRQEEKSFWSKLGDFALNALIVVAAVLAVVSLSAIFSDTVSNKLDEWTKDKDGKGGWGSAIRKAVGVSTETQDTSAMDKLSQMKDKASEKAKEWWNSVTNSEGKGAENTGPGVTETAVGAGLLYGAGKKAAGIINRPVHVDADGNSHKIPTHQLNTGKAVELAKEQIAAARLAQQEAAEKAAHLKVAKDAEDLQNKDKRFFQRNEKSANKAFAKADAVLKKATEKVTSLEGIITEGNEALAKGLEPNSTRWKEFVKKFSISGISGSEYDGIETAKPAAQAAKPPAVTTTAPASPPTVTEVQVGEYGRMNVAASQAPVTQGTSTVNAGGEYGDISATTKSSVGAPTTTPPPTPAQDTNIKVGKNGFVEFSNTNATSLAEAGKANSSLIETLNSIRTGGGRLLTTIGSYLTPAKIAGPLGATGVAIEDGARLHEGANHRDSEGNLDQKAVSTAQAVGTGAEMAGILRSAPGLFKANHPAALLGGEIFKDSIYVGTTIATGDPNATSKGFIANGAEKLSQLTGLDSVLESTIGPKPVKWPKPEERQQQFTADNKQEAINAKIMELSKTDLDHTKPQDQEAMMNARLRAVQAWRQLAADEGRLERINPQGLVEHVASHNWEMPPQTPGQPKDRVISEK